jgi:hypothetical protein
MARRKAELGADLDDRLTPDGFTRDDADAFIRPFDAGQAFRALGRLLLAEPEDELAAYASVCCAPSRRMPVS